MPARKHTCSFCGRDIADGGGGELLFVAAISGLPAAICSGCVGGYHALAVFHRKDPARAASFVATHNAAIQEGRQ